MITKTISPIIQGNEVKHLKVEFTTDLDQFGFIEGNRIPNLNHVRRLERSLKQNGVLIAPIIVNDKKEVIDGQHRIMAAKKANVGLYYIVVDNYSLEEVHTLNVNQKNWNARDYMEGYAELGIEPYVKLREFCRLYPEFSISSARHIMSGTITSATTFHHGKSGTKHIFSEGTFKCGSLENGIEIANKLREIGKYFPEYSNAGFVSAMVKIFRKEEFSIDRLLRKLTMQNFTTCANQRQWLEMIEEIYNYKSHNKVNLRY